MRVPLSWLRTLCDPGLPAAAVADRLAMTGTEVERIERIGVGLADAFVVGKVLSAERHPEADRLRVCEVDDGSVKGRTIVCGAPNVAEGQTVAVALPGAVLPDGRTLGEVALRGVVSSGMILAEDELGLGEDHDRIMVLPEALAPGTPLSEHLPIADEALELEVTPNRPDCLGVYGVARELHAATEAPLAADPTTEDAEPSGADRAEDHVAVEIADPEVCLRFTGRVFEQVRIGPSPAWLKARLIAAGQRPISNVVDITNYVMLLTGQPMHAFDLDEVRGRRVVVRRAREGERMHTLDGVERTFEGSMALVCDAEGPSSVAGLMGGQVSEVSGGTTRVLMEAATWVGTNILATSSSLGLRSEASTRFEKQLHPEGAMAAQRLAARLMVELSGARLVPGTLDAYPRVLEPRVVRLRLERVCSLLGQRVEAGEGRAILERLGFALSEVRENGRAASQDAVWDVTVPSFRDADVQREADLIEEIARVRGLDRLPVTLPARRRAVGGVSPAQRLRRRLEDALRERGMLEVVAYSFTAPRAIEQLRLGEGSLLRLENPLSEEASIMRPLLLPGLLDAARHNATHGDPDVALFESAHVYRREGGAQGPAQDGSADARAVPGGPSAGGAGHGGASAASTGSPAGARPARERHHIGGLLTRGSPGSWRSEARPVDFYAARGIVEGALEGVRVDWWAEAAERPFLHPGRTARLLAGGGRELGWIGELHPLVAREWDLEDAAAFELDADLLAELDPGPTTFRDLASFPAVAQDLAVVVDESVSAARVEAAVRAGGGELLEGATVFDLYRGGQIRPGAKSLALRLEFRAPDRTLTDEEVAERRASIEEELRAIGGRLRA